MVPENDPWLPFCAPEYQNAGAQSTASSKVFLPDRNCMFASSPKKILDPDPDSTSGYLSFCYRCSSSAPKQEIALRRQRKFSNCFDVPCQVVVSLRGFHVRSDL